MMPSTSGNSPLALYVLKKLPRDYLITPADLAWLDACDRFLCDEASPESVLEAVKMACKDPSITQHIDPYELLIDAQICTPQLEIMRVRKKS